MTADDAVSPATPAKAQRSGSKWDFLRWIGAILAVFLLSGDATQDEQAPEAPRVVVPDVVLLDAWNVQHTETRRMVYLPAYDAPQVVLEEHSLALDPRITRDGTQLIFTDLAQDGEQQVINVWSLDSSTMVRQWHAVIPTFACDPGDGVCAVWDWLALGERVYVAWTVWLGDAAVQMVALDRETGVQVGRWEIASDPTLPDTSMGSVHLVAAADESTLTLVTTRVDPADQGMHAARLSVVTLDPGTMGELQRLTPISDNPDVDPYALRGWNPTPDGTAFYAANIDGSAGPVQLEFLDLQAGRVTATIALEFARTEIGQLSFQSTRSADGTLLYIWDAIGAQVAVVDLVQRTLVATHAVDSSAVPGMGPPEGGRLFVFGDTMQFSADGKLLYAISFYTDNQPPNAVIAIDPATWKIVKHWPVDAYLAKVRLSGDGQLLYLPSMAVSDDGPRDEPMLRAIDLETGEFVTVIDQSGNLENPWGFETLGMLYQQQWGVAPLIDQGPTQPLARMDVQVSRDIVLPGDPVEVTLRYLDPRNNEPLTERTVGVRFDPPQHVQAIFSAGANVEQKTVVLMRTAFGEYRGSVQLTRADAWSLEVKAQQAGLPTRSVDKVDAVVVQQVLHGTDGQRYQVRLVPPVDAVAGGPTELSIEFFDTATNERIPDGVGIVNALPDALQVSAIPLSTRGVTSGTFHATGHGRYAGSLRFFEPDGWVVSVTLPRANGGPLTIRVGTLVVR